MEKSAKIVCCYRILIHKSRHRMPDDFFSLRALVVRILVTVESTNFADDK